MAKTYIHKITWVVATKTTFTADDWGSIDCYESGVYRFPVNVIEDSKERAQEWLETFDIVICATLDWLKENLGDWYDVTQLWPQQFRFTKINAVKIDIKRKWVAVFEIDAFFEKQNIDKQHEFVARVLMIDFLQQKWLIIPTRESLPRGKEQKEGKLTDNIKRGWFVTISDIGNFITKKGVCDEHRKFVELAFNDFLLEHNMIREYAHYEPTPKYVTSQYVYNYLRKKAPRWLYGSISASPSICDARTQALYVLLMQFLKEKNLSK
jgi:hypothetical protein